MDKKEFIEKLKACPIREGFSYFYEDILNLTNQYMKESGDDSPAECFKNFIDKDKAKEIAKDKLDEGFYRLHMFIASLDTFDVDYYYLTDSGYLENITEGSLQDLVEDIIYCIGE